MNTIPIEIEAINNLMLNIMPRFRSYIADRNIPLSERWEVFKKAPLELSEESSFMPAFSNFNMGDWIYQFDIDRYSFHKTVEWVDDCLVESLAEYSEGEETNEEDFEKVSKSLDPLREEILQMNIKTFIVDW